MNVRPVRAEERPFVIEMARHACTLDDRPLPSPDAPAVIALLPDASDLALVAVDRNTRLVGAAWWHFHQPALMLDAAAAPLPELAMAVVDDCRGEGIGTALVEALVQHGSSAFEALTLNVHLRNPAIRLYMRTGFVVAGAGRGPFGVAMSRPLQRAAATR